MEKKAICRDINGQPHEFSLEELTFRPSIYGVIVKNGKVLLHRYGEGYDFPGGGIDTGEKHADALVREVREETGVTITMGEPLTVLTDMFVHPGTQKPYHTILLYYAGINPKGEISDEFFDAHEKEVASLAEWVDIDKVASLTFFNPMTASECAALVHKAASLQ